MAVFEEGRGFKTLAHKCPTLWKEILAKGKPVKVIISSIEPGQKVAKHVDAGPHYERRHLPITAPVHWWDEDNGEMLLEQGEWSQTLPFWRLHSVSNPTDSVRITVIADFDKLL